MIAYYNDRRLIETINYLENYLLSLSIVLEENR